MKTVFITAFDPNNTDLKVTEFDMEVDDYLTEEDIEPIAQREVMNLTGQSFCVIEVKFN